MYYTYMLRCKDNSIYTGITNNLERRMKEHFIKNKKCAKYTLYHNALCLELVFKSDSRKTASKLEYHIKHLSKSQKEFLVQNPEQLEFLLASKIDCHLYQKITFHED